MVLVSCSSPRLFFACWSGDGRNRARAARTKVSSRNASTIRRTALACPKSSIAPPSIHSSRNWSQKQRVPAGGETPGRRAALLSGWRHSTRNTPRLNTSPGSFGAAESERALRRRAERKVSCSSPANRARRSRVRWPGWCPAAIDLDRLPHAATLAVRRTGAVHFEADQSRQQRQESVRRSDRHRRWSGSRRWPA